MALSPQKVGGPYAEYSGADNNEISSAFLHLVIAFLVWRAKMIKRFLVLVISSCWFSTLASGISCAQGVADGHA